MNAFTQPSSSHYLLCTFPDEILLTIFSYLKERDLCRVAQVCKRFNVISNDHKLWRKLYTSLFEYEVPMYRFGPCKYKLISSKEDLEEEERKKNPWKESFRQLNVAVHVRPGKEDLYSDLLSGRNIACVDTIYAAISLVQKDNQTQQRFILLHSNHYSNQFLVIDKSIEVSIIIFCIVYRYT